MNIWLENVRQKAFIAGWRAGLEVDFCESPPEELTQMAYEDWKLYYESTLDEDDE